MAGVGTNDVHFTVPPDDFAILANPPHAGTNLHGEPQKAPEWGKRLI
jgi:hypothetical protein